MDNCIYSTYLTILTLKKMILKKSLILFIVNIAFPKSSGSYLKH